jgi:hypothetical protein
MCIREENALKPKASGWKSLQCENFQSTFDLQKFQAYPIFMQGTPKLIKMQEMHNL